MRDGTASRSIFSAAASPRFVDVIVPNGFVSVSVRRTRLSVIQAVAAAVPGRQNSCRHCRPQNPQCACKGNPGNAATRNRQAVRDAPEIEIAVERNGVENEYAVYVGGDADLPEHDRMFPWGVFDDCTIPWQRARADAMGYAKSLATKLKGRVLI
jgi:hypothetical protein